MSLHEPARHEPLGAVAWDAPRAHAAIEWIVRDTVARFSARSWWPVHPDDRDPGDDADLPSTTLYFGATGVLWALRYLEAVGAVARTGLAAKADLRALRDANRATLASWGHADDLGSWLMGELPIAMMAAHDEPDGEMAASLPGLVERTLHHPARELMWGAPGALLAASFLHERNLGDDRWAARFRRIAAQLRSELRWSDDHGCGYWDQDLYGRRSTYLDAVHGFVATAHALIRGRHLLAPGEWPAWQDIITTTVGRTATWEGDQASWRPELVMPEGSAPKRLMQYCHGAPGFVVCLAGLPHEPALDGLLDAAGRATWAAGPLRKGSNLCHGTAGNGYAFLKLYQRSGQAHWLDKARAFAMHAIGQAEAAAARHGQLRYSLWTGDPGLAIYLWDCLRGNAAFPTLDVFDGTR
jgi:hypothetical protein